MYLGPMFDVHFIYSALHHTFNYTVNVYGLIWLEVAWSDNVGPQEKKTNFEP